MTKIILWGLDWAEMQEKIKSAKFIRFVAFLWSYFILFLVGIFIESLVFLCLWHWFMMPLGLPVISILHAMGLMIFLDFITYHYYDFKKSEEASVVIPFKYIFVRPLIAFIMGFLIHLIQLL